MEIRYNKKDAIKTDDIDISVLPKYLEKAYWLVHKDMLVDKGALPDDLASIGGLDASISTRKSDDSTLTEEERKIAKKLGVSEEAYLQNKKLKGK